MKKVKFFLPVLVNAVLSIIFNYGTYLYERSFGTQYDFILYMDGREEYRFGAGSFSLLFIVILFIIMFVWIMTTAKKYENKILESCYRTVNIILISAINIFWIVFYIDWYNLSYFWIFLRNKMP